ncbi:MAG: MiaB/RimO family radical SAM methylthiotransferase, partial [Firmicutes bacterium]|nr:MiaB/RimO family radical SAM methylthiotransferase [Bacillota bacterium]
NSYKGEGEDKVWDFADLIRAVNDVEGIERIRFMTSHPKDLSDKLLDCFRDCSKLCHYFHLPVQSGSSSVLKKMNRRYDRERYLDLVRKLREIDPEMAISTDIIVGFPGETEEEFNDTLTLCEEVGFDSAFTFLYSIRKGTPAATYEDQIPEEIKHERFNRLCDSINTVSAMKNAAYVGRTVEVLCDGPSKRNSNKLSGRTDTFKLVNFKGDPALMGQMLKVKITSSNTFSLEGEIV